MKNIFDDVLSLCEQRTLSVSESLISALKNKSADLIKKKIQTNDSGNKKQNGGAGNAAPNKSNSISIERALSVFSDRHSNADTEFIVRPIDMGGNDAVIPLMVGRGAMLDCTPKDHDEIAFPPLKIYGVQLRKDEYERIESAATDKNSFVRLMAPHMANMTTLSNMKAPVFADDLEDLMYIAGDCNCSAFVTLTYLKAVDFSANKLITHSTVSAHGNPPFRDMEAYSKDASEFAYKVARANMAMILSAFYELNS